MLTRDANMRILCSILTNNTNEENKMNRGDIIKLSDHYRIYQDAEHIFYYTTDDYETALKVSNELKENN